MKSRPARKIFYAISVFTGLFWVSNLLAIIGDTMEQSDARYGVALQKGADWRIYKKSEMEIRVHFYDGLTDSVSYRKLLPDKSGKKEEISFEEIAVLLDNNSKGAEWKDLAKGYKLDDVAQKKWECKKPPLRAYYDNDKMTLYIEISDLNALRKTYLHRSKVNTERLVNSLGI